MRRLLFFAFCLSAVAMFMSCQKDEPEPIASEIIRFEVNPDSVEVNGFVEITFERSSAENVGISTAWKKTGGEFLYHGGMVPNTPVYWKAPETPGTYQIWTYITSHNRDFDFEYTSADTVSVVVY